MRMTAMRVMDSTGVSNALIQNARHAAVASSCREVCVTCVLVTFVISMFVLEILTFTGVFVVIVLLQDIVVKQPEMGLFYLVDHVLLDLIILW